jgi:hypothetical protein
MKHDGFFRTHPVFTGEELSERFSSHGDAVGRAQEAILAYHRKTEPYLSDPQDPGLTVSLKFY